jgi:hypothetical protein
MPDPLLYVAAQGAAAVASAVFVLAIGWLWKPVGILRCQVASIVGIAGGWGTGSYVLGLPVAWPPLNGLDRFLTIVLPAALAIEFAATFLRAPRSLAWLMRFTLAAAMGRILLHDSVYISGAEPQWSLLQATVVLLTCSALIAVVWGLLVWLSVRFPAGGSVALALALTLQTTGISIMLAGYLQGGAAAFALSAATVGTVASLSLLTGHQNVGAPIGICVVGLGSLLMIGRFFGGLSTEVALILMLAPLLCWGTELPPLRFRPAWVVGSLRLLLVAIPLAALLLQAKRKFDRDTAPLLIQRSDSRDCSSLPLSSDQLQSWHHPLTLALRQTRFVVCLHQSRNHRSRSVGWDQRAQLAPAHPL